jgi:hypothetical protein
MPPGGSGKHTHLNSGKGLKATGGSYEASRMVSDDGHVAPTDANLACTGLLESDLAAGSHYGTWTSSEGSQETLPISCVNWYEAREARRIRERTTCIPSTGAIIRAAQGAAPV